MIRFSSCYKILFRGRKLPKTKFRDCEDSSQACDRSRGHIPNASLPYLYRNSYKDVQAKWEIELETNSEVSDIHACIKSNDSLDEMLNGDLSKCSSVTTTVTIHAFVKIQMIASNSSCYVPKPATQNYENISRNLDTKREETHMKMAFGDIGTCAKRKEASVLALKGDASKLDSVETKFRDDAFVKVQENVDNLSCYFHNVTSQQHEYAPKDILAKWEEELEKISELSDIETYAKSIESLDPPMDISKLNSAEKKILCGAFVKMLQNICNSGCSFPNASTQQCENGLKDTETKWDKELEKNAEFRYVETDTKSEELFKQVLTYDLSKLNANETILLIDALGKMHENISNSSCYSPNATTQQYENDLRFLQTGCEEELEKNAQLSDVRFFENILKVDYSELDLGVTTAINDTFAETVKNADSSRSHYQEITTHQYENGRRDTEAHWEEECKKNAKLTDIEAYAS